MSKVKSLFEDKEYARLKARNALYDFIGYFIGSLIYAVSVDMFTAPNEIAPGGATGIATVLYSVFGWKIGLTTMLINVPLFILGAIFIGRRYLGKTVVSLVVSSVAIDLMASFLPVYTGDKLLAALFGGILSGIGLGLVFMRGGSTGGTDIVARLLGKVFPHMTQGRLILIIDTIVITCAAFVYGLEGALYAIVTLFVSSVVIDRVMYGNDTGKLLLIVTDESVRISEEINGSLERGTTLIKCAGGYSGEEHDIVMCAVRSNEVYKIRWMIRYIDPSAFIIVSDATEIVGEGFKAINKNEFGETE